MSVATQLQQSAMGKQQHKPRNNSETWVSLDKGENHKTSAL
jgi:hypothetical protein